MSSSLYQVELTTNSVTYVLPDPLSVHWQDLERIHRRNLRPNVLVARRLRITVEGNIPGDPAPALLETFEAFHQAHINPSDRDVPAITIREADGTAIADLGTIDASDGWEDVQVVAFELPPEEGQLQGGVRFTLVIEGLKQYPDGDGVVNLEQRWERSADASSLEEQVLTSSVTLDPETVANVASLAHLFRLAKPSGWVYTRGCNRSGGIAITYPNYPRLDEAVVISAIKAVGGSVTPETLAGEGTTVETRERTDPETGLKLKQVTARAVGGGTPLTWVKGYELTKGVGETTHDEGGNTAVGTWEEVTGRYRPDLPGKLCRVRRVFQFSPGGVDLDVLPMSKGYLPIIRDTPVAPWSLLERITASALGALDITDMPVPPPLPRPWRHASRRATWTAPHVVRAARHPSQHVWEATLVRFYFWDGEGDPTEDPATREALMRGYLVSADMQDWVAPSQTALRGVTEPEEAANG